MNLRIALLTFALTACLGAAGLAGEPPVQVEKGWVRAVPPASTDTAAYMILINNSGEPLRLTAGRTPIAEMVMPMITTKKTVNGQEIMGMNTVDSLVIPAHGRLTLSPDGDHLMLMNLKEHPAAGTSAKLTLHFEPGAQELTIELPVALAQP